MSLIARKIAAFAKKVADLADRPGGTVPTAELKAQFDSSPEELRVAHNGLVDDLSSTAAGASGAHQIGSETITGVVGNNVHDQLSDIKAQLNGAALGQIPDNSITASKLSFDPTTQVEFDARNADYEYQTPSIIGTQIRIQKSSATSRLFFKLTSDLSGSITISLDGGATSKPLKDVDGADVTSLTKGYAEVVADATFFTLRPKGGNIKSIQRGTISFPNGGTSLTLTVPISAVDPNKSIVEFEKTGSNVSGQNTLQVQSVSGEITDATTLTFLKDGNTSSANTVINWIVYEFSNVKSKQFGTKALAAVTDTITISDVNLSKCRLFTSRTSTSTGTDFASSMYRCTFTNSTTITVNQSANLSGNLKWQLIEFY